MLNKIYGIGIFFIISIFHFSSPTLASYYVVLKDNTFDPGKGKVIQTMFLVNDGDTIKAIELTTKKRSATSSGEEIMTDTDDLIAVPGQVILPPGAERAVSLRWAGTKIVPRELSYRVIVEELPVGESQKKSSKMIRTKIKFIKSIDLLTPITKLIHTMN